MRHAAAVGLRTRRRPHRSRRRARPRDRDTRQGGGRTRRRDSNRRQAGQGFGHRGRDGGAGRVQRSNTLRRQDTGGTGRRGHRSSNRGRHSEARARHGRRLAGWQGRGGVHHFVGQIAGRPGAAGRHRLPKSQERVRTRGKTCEGQDCNPKGLQRHTRRL